MSRQISCLSCFWHGIGSTILANPKNLLALIEQLCYVLVTETLICTLNVVKSRIVFLLLGLLGVALVPASFANLLNVSLDFPKISFVSQDSSAINYNASSQLFSVTAIPTTVLFNNGETPRVITGAKNFQIQAIIDNSGNLIGGAGGDDFSLSGSVTEGANTYSGLLLTGGVSGFGFLASGASSLYDFRFSPTAGALFNLFHGNISVQLISEISTFNGDFRTDFHGTAKGSAGSESIPDRANTFVLSGIACLALALFAFRARIQAPILQVVRRNK